nr:hypothetical protein [Tanacetum cinerariifolium]
MFIKYSTGQIPPKKSRGKDVPLELGKSISLTKAKEEEAANQVHVTHARNVTESVPKSAKKKTGTRSSRSAVIQDTPSAPKTKLVTSKPKLKGVQSLTPAEKEAADIMQALKESKKTSKRQPGTRGSSEGTCTIQGVPDESKVISTNSSEGTSTKPGVLDEEKVITKENVILKWGSKQESEYLEEDQLDDEEEDDKEGDADDKDAKKTEEAKDDSKKAELPLTSSSLSISSGFVDLFLKLSSDTSLIGTVKDTIDAEISSLVDIKIQYDVLHIQSSSVLKLRVAKLEKDVSELKKIDHSAKALTTVKSQVPTVVDQYIRSKIGDDLQKHNNDDEDPPDGPNQGKKTKRRRTKESESLKKPSSTKETPKDKALSKGSKTGKSASTKEPVEEPIAEVVMDDASENVQPPRHPTPDLEWNKHQVVLGQPEESLFNQMVSATKDPLTFNDLIATPIDFSKYVLNRIKINNLTQDLLLGLAYDLLKGTCTSNIKLEYKECFNALIDKLDWNNPEGDMYPFDPSKPLPLQGRPCHLTIATDYFFNNDLEYLKSFDLERTYTTSITKIKAARYEIVGIEDIVPMLWSTIKHAYDKDAAKGIKHLGESVKSVSVKKLHGYGHLEEVMVKELIDSYASLKKMRKRRIIRNMERLVGARELEMDYKILSCEYCEYVV